VASFPVVLGFSWMFDISAKGIQRTESALSGAALAKLHLMQSVGLVVSLVLAGVVSVWLWP